MTDEESLEVIERTVEKVGKLPRKERLAEVNRILCAGAHFSEAQLKLQPIRDLLHRRALFVTALRQKGIWP